MNESERNRLIDRIRKVVALSTSPNEAEAAAAASKAQAMLAEYNLSMSDIETNEEKPDEDFIEDRDEITESVPWRRQIAINVAKLYFCEYFYIHKKIYTATRKCGYIRKDIQVFIGAKHNVLVAKMLFKYLCDTVERLADQGSLQVPVRERSSYITSFKWACTGRLGARLRDQLEKSKRGEAKTEAGKNLPALLDLYAKTQNQLQCYLDDKHKELKVKTAKVTQSNLRGMLDGRAAGDKIGLDPQVAGNKSALLR